MEKVHASLPPTEFFETCVIDVLNNGKKFYTDFGINEKSARIYGREISDIIEVKCKISKNQEKVNWNSLTSEEKLRLIIGDGLIIKKISLK